MRPLLCIDTVQELFLGQNVEYSSDSLEEDRLIVFKEVRETPRLKRVVTPNQQVGALVDLSDSHCTTALHIEVIDVETKVMDCLILAVGLVKARVDGFSL